MTTAPAVDSSVSADQSTASKTIIAAHLSTAGAGELLAPGVEQVGDAVQRHRCLAGARPTLDHHDAAGGVPDDLVLLALDGFHDGAHVTGAGLVHRAAQRRLGSDTGM